MSQPIEITRYPNRRLYDRNQKKYVTLGDLETMVLEGHDVRVRDSKSNEDLTRSILVQILIERHPERMKLFPVSFLLEILRADQMALDWLSLYFGQAKAAMDGMGNATTGTVFPGMELWRSMMPGGASPNPASRDEPAGAGRASPTHETNQAGPSSAEPAARVDLPGSGGPAQEDLAAKLAELESRLRQLEGSDSGDAT